MSQVIETQNKGGESNTTVTSAWHATSTDVIADRLNTDLEGGLTTEEAKLRGERFGPNQLQSDGGSSWLQVLGRQFRDVLILILFVAAGVSVVVGEWTDAATILAIIVLNGVLGFFQEWKAERALSALRNLPAPTCQVIRDNAKLTLDAALLVPCDLVRIETGSRIPADLRLTETQNLAIDESALTGESASVNKHADTVATGTPLAKRASMVWMGTASTTGRVLCIVVQT